MGRLRRAAIILTAGSALQLGSCSFDEFEGTFTLDSRDVVSFLVKSWVLTPLENWVDAGIDELFSEEEE
jgi:hypothetical protein